MAERMNLMRRSPRRGRLEARTAALQLEEDIDQASAAALTGRSRRTVPAAASRPAAPPAARGRSARCAAMLPPAPGRGRRSESELRSEEHTSELQSLMRISYAVFCLKQKCLQATSPRHALQHTGQDRYRA